MIYALISDVHGNLEALTAVLDDIRKTAEANEIIFLGDAVGYGASPNEALQLINSECSIQIMGNHDSSALGLLDSVGFNPFAREAINYTAAILTDESRSILSVFKMTEKLGDAFLVHASPQSPERWDYCLTVEEAGRQFAHFPGRLCLIGHSHQPALFGQNGSQWTEKLTVGDVQLENGHRYVANVGSVGQPRDGDPRAGYAVYDSTAETLRFRRVGYDIQHSQARMQVAGLPTFLIERLATGR
jgi:diadenosine tetraphosphatase ApaH/serine/threonine PP2A family protein phosphatase